MRIPILFICSGLCFVQPALAEGVKKGHVLCQGGDCEIKTSEFSRGIKERIKKRIEIPKIKPKPAKKIIPPEPEKTNLPPHYQGVSHAGFQSSDKVVFVPKASDFRLKGLKSGDIVWAVIEQEIVASPGIPTPVRAMAIGGAFKNALFLGEATLDRELKRVLFQFSKLRLKDTPVVYALKASGLSPKGSIGLEGEYTAQSGKFFISELASQTTSRILESPAASSIPAKSVGGALHKTAERQSEAAGTAPEYTQVSGYQEIQIIIQEDPVESGE